MLWLSILCLWGGLIAGGVLRGCRVRPAVVAFSGAVGVAGCVYAYVGRPDLPDHPQSVMRRQAPDSTRQLLDKLPQLETTVGQFPDNPEGWHLLIQSYRMLGREVAAEVTQGAAERRFSGVKPTLSLQA